MKITVENTACTCIIGGKDNLLSFDIIQKMREYMRVRPKGYERSPSFKKHQWDGWKYFVTPSGKFATGYLPVVHKFLTSLGVLIEIEDKRTNLPVLCEDFNDRIGIIDGVEWIARPEQVEAVKSLKNYVIDDSMYFPRGILDCATNAGKTSMAALVVNNLEGKQNVLFVCSSKIIYSQAIKFFSQVIGEPVGQVCAGKLNFKWFTVAMVKTLLNKAKESMQVKKQLASVSVLLVDESDESGAADYSKLLLMVNAGMRVFMSGTPLEASKVNNMISLGLSGPVLHKITNRELIDLGRSQEPKIKIILNKSKDIPFLSYQEEESRNIHTSTHRLELIGDLVEENLDKSILISFNITEHGEFMLEGLQKRFPALEIDILHGKHKDSDREDKIDRFKRGKINVLLASMVIKRGANVPNIQCLIRAEGGKSEITTKQILGRALRHDGENDFVPVYDFYDTGKYLAEHSRIRIRTYIKEQLQVTFNYEHKRYFPV